MVVDQGQGPAIRVAMRDLLDAGPEPLSAGEVDDHRYGIGDLVDDLSDSPPGLERLSVTARLVDALIKLELESAGLWSGRGTWIIRELRRRQPLRFEELETAAERAVEDPGPLVELANDWLESHGGRLVAGYHRDGQARTDRLRREESSEATEPD